MAIARDTSQDCSASNDSTTSLTATFPATAGAGKLLVAVAACGDQKLVVTGPSGWTKATDVEHNSQTFSLSCYYKIAAGTETGPTFSIPSAAAIRIGAYQYSGAVTSSPLDKVASAQSGGSQVASLATGTTASTAQADELMITAVALNVSGTAIGWTNGTELVEPSSHTFSVAQRIVAATSTYSDTASWTGNVFCCALIATFKADLTGAGGGVAPYIGIY